MGVLKLKEAVLDKKSLAIKDVLDHFDRLEKKYPVDVLQKISAAADNAFSDNILFEEFDNWVNTRNDESFVYLINHYWATKDNPSLNREADLSGKEEDIAAIKEKAKNQSAQKFSQILNDLCLKNNLKTLKEIGNFLGGMSEERVRVLLDGKHRPQRATILKIGEKFKVDPTQIMKALIE